MELLSDCQLSLNIINFYWQVNLQQEIQQRSVVHTILSLSDAVSHHHQAQWLTIQTAGMADQLYRDRGWEGKSSREFMCAWIFAEDNENY